MPLVLTEKGLVIPNLSETEASLVAKYQTNIHPNITTQSDTFLGQNISILSEAQQSVYSLIEWLHNQKRVSTAEDTFLDDIGEYKNLPRLLASKSYVTMKFTGTEGIIIPLNTLVDDPSTKVRFSTQVAKRVTSLDCTSAIFLCNTTAASVNLSLKVFTTTFTQSTGAGGTGGITSALTALGLQITTAFPTLTVTSNSNSITISATDETTSTSIVPIAYFDPGAITTNIECASSTVGSATIPTYSSAYSIITPVLGLTNVQPVMTAIIEGIDKEKDSDYRTRIITSESSGGKATIPALITALRNTTGVTTADVLENDTNAVGGGVPAYGIHCIVQGGADLDVAKTIYRTRAASTPMTGSVIVRFTDESSSPRIVKFSRPIEVSIDVQVDYEPYPEETISPSAEAAMKTAICDYINGLNIGKDVIPTRIIPPIYLAVTGVAVNSVLIRLHGGGSFSSSTIVIPAGSYASCVPAQVSFV